MRILVRTLRGDRVALDVDGATTVAQVKSMVVARERIPADMQRLFFAGRQLDDDGRPLAHYGVLHDSVLFLSLRLQQETHDVPMPSVSTTTVEQESNQQQQQMLVLHEEEGDDEKAVKRKPVSRRSLRKILARLQVDTWTKQRDAKFIDLLLRHTGGGEWSVAELTGEDWSAIRAELNAATGSGFAVEGLQRRLAEFRHQVEAMGRIKSHPRFRYDSQRQVVVATEADWKRYTLENPEAVAYEGRNPHLRRLRKIFSGDGCRPARGAKCRESLGKRYLNKLLRSFGLHCKL